MSLIVDEKALSATNSPQILTGSNPLNRVPTFYGLGWNVSYDEEGRLHLGRSGAFALGEQQPCHWSRRNACAFSPTLTRLAIAEGLGFTFTDIALYGKATQQWLALFKKMFSNPAALGVLLGTDYSQAPASQTPALPVSAYVGTYTNKFFGDIQITEEGDRLAIVEGPRKFDSPIKAL